MRERVEGMGGQLSLQSARGEGTAISIVIPLSKLTELSLPAEAGVPDALGMPPSGGSAPGDRRF
jgi:hypothetical protein